ncbi:MAG: glycosyltransferase family 4 protein [Myxococcaceae bacterium]
MRFGIAILASMFPPSIGGIQNQTLSLAKTLSEYGVEVHVITRPVSGAADDEVMDGVAVHRVGSARGPGKLRSAAYVAGALARLNVLRARVDLIHAQQLLSPSLSALLSRTFTRLPVVVNPHACGPIGDIATLRASALGRLRLAATVRLADAFVAISHTIHGELRGAGVPEKAIWDVPNGVDVARFRPAIGPEKASLRRSLGLPEGPLAVYTGRLAPEKGVDVLLEAWPRVQARLPGTRLWIVGDGDEAGRLSAQAGRLCVSPTVAFAGAVADVSPYLRAADAAVLPSRSEGLPVAMLEAMACGLPVVATRVGGSAQVLEDGITGRLISPEDPASLGAALVEALSCDGARGFGERARATVLERYGIERVAARLIAHYEQLLSEGGP